MYRDGGRFLIKGDRRYVSANCDICFPVNPEFRNKEYRTVAGPCFANKSRMYISNANGIRGATRRVTCAREPTIPGLHEELRRNQYNNVTLNDDVIWVWSESFRNRLRVLLFDFNDSECEKSRWAEETHPKRALRMQALASLRDAGKIDDATYMRSVDYKCKTGELLPNKKYLRAIGDMTTPGSIKCAYLMDAVKNAFKQPYTVNNIDSEFVKTPQLGKLRSVFGKLNSPPKDGYFAYFSDDSVGSYRCIDGIFRFNMDISAADGSNFDPVFQLLQYCMDVDTRFSKDVDGVFKQLLAIAVVRNPENRKQKVKLRPTGKVLYSGSSLTTCVNNCANQLICLRFASRYANTTLTKSQVSAALVSAARDVGYLVKIEECVELSDIQFLKYSPHINCDGVIDAVLNLGVLLRSFGTFLGDFPGSNKIPFAVRVEQHLTQVVRGRTQSGNHCINEAFNKRFAFSGGKEVVKTYFEEIVTGEQLGYVDSHSLASRYGVRSIWVEELAHLIETCSVGQMICHPILEHIFSKDYGY